jgi:hypothetical protein
MLGYLAFIKVLDLGMQLTTERGQLRNRCIRPYLGGAACSWDNHRYCIEVKNPTQCHVGQCQAFWYQQGELISKFYSFLKGNTGKGFSHIERSTVTVVIAMVILPESWLSCAWYQSTVRWQAALEQ